MGDAAPALPEGSLGRLSSTQARNWLRAFLLLSQECQIGVRALAWIFDQRHVSGVLQYQHLSALDPAFENVRRRDIDQFVMVAPNHQGWRLDFRELLAQWRIVRLQVIKNLPVLFTFAHRILL